MEKHLSPNMDPRRKRLTVTGRDASSEVPGRGGRDTEGDNVARAGLTEAFERLNGAKAVSITSVTDKDLTRRLPYADKDQEVIVPPRSGSADELCDWVKSQGIAWKCKKGKKPESPNQDSFSILMVEGQFSFYGVFDGHGPDGHVVSDVARQVLLKLFLQHPSRSTNPGVALREVFVETQRALETSEKERASASGSTCTVAYHDIQQQTITIAHVGDSRSVLGKGRDRKTVAGDVEDLTIDHKPNLEKERKRIESANPPGRVVHDGYYNHRVFVQNGMYPGLNMSRALGDIVAHKEAGLTAEPDIKVVDLKAQKARNQELLLLLCTDGVWEFIESKEAVIIASEQATPDDGVEKLARESFNRWMKDSEGEISDDITAIMVRL